jgi:hypothetical protein
MGQISAVDRLPETLYLKLVEMLNDPGLPQSFIADEINTQAGKQLLTRPSLNRFIKRMEKLTGTKRGRFIAKTSGVEESLDKIATALERIASSLEKQYKKTS